MLNTQNEMIFFHISFIPLKNETFHLIGENLWLTAASYASMQFPKYTGFDKGKLNDITFFTTCYLKQMPKIDL